MNRLQRFSLIFACIIVPVALLIWFTARNQKLTTPLSPSPSVEITPIPTLTPTAAPSATSSPTPAVTATAPTQSSLVPPVAEFKSRITKKFFGTYITPTNSPVQSEKFTGYHTGVDVEYTDKPNEEIPIHAIAAGEVVLSRRATGYGGVIVIRHTVNDQQILAIYGHLAPTSLPPVGRKVTANDIIGHLGQGGTSETDGERKHLHFAILKGSTVDIRGYVQTKAELSGWYDPLSFYK